MALGIRGITALGVRGKLFTGFGAIITFSAGLGVFFGYSIDEFKPGEFLKKN